MKSMKTSRPSPALVVGALALVGALAGTAVAGPDASTSAINKKKVKKIATKQINKLAPGLSVANAETAGNANTLGGQSASAFATKNTEPYRRIGAPGEPAFQNGWSNSGAGSAAFYKDPFAVVHLRGSIHSSTGGTAAFTLPPGYRPSQTLFLPMAALGPAAGNLQVTVDGRVLPACATNPCDAGIDGLTFRAQ